VAVGIVVIDSSKRASAEISFCQSSNFRK